MNNQLNKLMAYLHRQEIFNETYKEYLDSKEDLRIKTPRWADLHRFIPEMTNMIKLGKEVVEASRIEQYTQPLTISMLEDSLMHFNSAMKNIQCNYTYNKNMHRLIIYIKAKRDFMNKFNAFIKVYTDMLGYTEEINGLGDICNDLVYEDDSSYFLSENDKILLLKKQFLLTI